MIRAWSMEILLPCYSFTLCIEYKEWWRRFWYFNTLPSGHEKTRDCSLMRCWWVMSFFIFLHNVLHMRLSAGPAHLSLQGYWQHDAGCFGLKLPTNRPVLTPIFRKIRLKQRDRSFRYSVFLQLQSWLWVGTFCSRIFCVSYMRIHVLMSLVIVTVKVWTVTVTSSQLVHLNNCDLLLVHWPHNFHTHFSSHLTRQFL